MIGDITSNLERYLSQMGCSFQENNDELYASIVVNASVIVDYDEYGNPYLILELPKEIYLRCRESMNNIEKEICKRYNNIVVSPDHKVTKVKLTIKQPEENWREESSVYLKKLGMLIPSVEKRIWGESPLRVFFSYTEDNFNTVKGIKEKIASFGITCFVAKCDVSPSMSWADEIKNALKTADVFVAFLTEGFYNSEWTGQEMGFAICRDIPLILINLGNKPRGFISDIQMLQDFDIYDLADELFAKLCEYIEDENKIQSLKANSAVYKLKYAGSYEDANTAARKLYNCSHISEDHVKEIIQAYNSNRQVREAYEIVASNTTTGNIRIVEYLKQATGKHYHVVNGILSIDNNPIES